MRCCEKSGDRTGSTRGGAGDGDAGAQRAARADRGAHERRGARGTCRGRIPMPSLRDRIVALAHRHRRYGAGMIYLKLRQEGRRGQSQAGRSALRGGAAAGAAPAPQEGAGGRPPAAARARRRRNEVWSADFVFDRTAEGRVLKCLTIVDDATTEAVAMVPARALGGLPVTRVLEQLARARAACRRCCAPTTAWSSAGARC